MGRLIFTFDSLFQVLNADRALRDQLQCRPTPTPPGLSTSICAISLEILQSGDKEKALSILDNAGMKPRGIHTIG